MLLFAVCTFAACASEPVRTQADPAGSDAGVAPDVAMARDSGPAEADAGEPLPSASLIQISAEPQRSGDPGRGYETLVNGGYVGCGVPHSAYAVAVGPAPEWARLPGRNAMNVDMPYNQTAFTTSSSVTVVSPNCLFCHAARLNGEVIIGLGDASADFTGDPAQTAQLVGLLLNDPAERAEWEKWAERVNAVGPYVQADVRGVNPADNIAGILFAHRVPKTLEWSSTPLLEPPPVQVVPVDVPPWWRMNKKNAMFYTAAGRGDHARIMMTASTLCIDSVDDARRIDAQFNDVRAYITSIEAPPYPWAIDAALAARGEILFNSACAGCHGTYGEPHTYPNLVIATEEIGTDPILASGASFHAGRFVDWFNSSFYGETARLQPEAGYIAPPLDGIWATAPYLHNGSVPTIELILDGDRRPQFWSRSFSDADYDREALGWKHVVEDHGHADEPGVERRKQIYDTTLFGYSNAGHDYGETLTSDERAAVIEYLKTL